MNNWRNGPKKGPQKGQRMESAISDPRAFLWIEADRNIAFKGNKIRLVLALFAYAILHVKDVDIFETQNVDGHSK